MNKEDRFMSVKEIAYSIIDDMTEEQLETFFALFGRHQKQENIKKVKSVRGIFAKAANPDLIPLEKNAWEQAAAENEKTFWESYSDENT